METGGLEEFLSRVDEVEGLVRDITSATDTDSISTALDNADDYLSREASEEDCHGATVGFDRTVINHQTKHSNVSSSSFSPEANTDQVAFCKALEDDSKERAERREMRQIMGRKMKSEGNDAFRKEMYKEALSHYSEALQELPGDVLLYTNRALTYLKLGQFHDVLTDCDTALKFDKETLKAYLYKGKALICMDRHNEARDCFDTAVSLLPGKETTIRSYVKNIENWSSNV